MESLLGETSSWPLWPIHGGKPLPSDHSEFVFEDPIAPIHDRVIGDVFHPRVFAYAPKTANGRAVLVLAGGGYTKLVIGKEGVEVAQWLNTLGLHCFVQRLLFGRRQRRFVRDNGAAGGVGGDRCVADDQEVWRGLDVCVG